MASVIIPAISPATNESSETMTNSVLTSRTYSPRSIGPRDIDRWSELEQRSLEPNAYLSPNFVLPACRHLMPNCDVQIRTVEDQASGRMLALIVVHECTQSPRFPIRHLCASKSVHAFESGLLVDRDHAEPALTTLWQNFRGEGTRALEMLYRGADSPQWDLVEATARRAGFHWCPYKRYQRAALLPNGAADRLIQHVSAKRRKAIRKSIRELEKLGTVGYRVVRSPDDVPAALDRLLALEHRGWKADQNVSLKSHSNSMLFFKAMTQAFLRDSRIDVCELTLNGQAIASTVQLRAGSWGHAFKMGWDPRFADQKIGILQQWMTAEHADREMAGLELIDSGTEADSFFERYWPDRRTIVSGIFAAGGVPRMLVHGVSQLRSLRHWLRRKPAPAPIVGDPSEH